MANKVFNQPKVDKQGLYVVDPDSVIEDAEPMVSYLLFRAVLTHDLELAENLLAAGVKPKDQLMFRFIMMIDSNLRHNLDGSDELRKKYTHYVDNKNKFSEKPNLLEVVCLSEEESGRENMLKLLLKYKTELTIDTVADIVSNPVADRTCWDFLLNEIQNRMSNPQDYVPCKKFTFTSLFGSVLDSKWTPLSTQETREFFVASMQRVLDIYVVDYENDKNEWMVNLELGMRKSIQHHESDLMMLFFEKQKQIMEQFLMEKEEIREFEWYLSMLKAALCFAIKHRSYYCLHLLILTLRAKPWDLKTMPYTPLSEAVKQGDLFALSYLLTREDRQEMSWLTKLHHTPLHDSAAHMKENCLLLWMLCAREECSVNIIGESNESVLSLLSRNNSKTSTEILLQKYNADVNQCHNDFGITPLFWAVRNRNRDIVRLCLRANCDTEIEFCGALNRAPVTPAALALHWRHYDTLRILLVGGATVPPKCRGQLSPYAQKEPDDSPDKELEDWLTEWLAGPAELKYQCRRLIRKIVGSKMDSKLKQLRYPQFLKDLITTDRLF